MRRVYRGNGSEIGVNVNWYKKANEDFDNPEELEGEEKEYNSLDDFAEENKGGDCYEVHGKYLMDQSMFGNKSLVLVHGEVTGQGPIAGVKYGHGWIEDGDTVLDMSRGRNIRMPKDVYYALAHIDPSNTFRYTMNDLRAKVNESGTWGPWDLQTQF
jgi:hypothetical protein